MWLASALPLFAADPVSKQFDDARKAFNDGFFARAENSFSNFVAQFPASPQVQHALLLQAQAALAQSRFTVAAQLLSTNLPRAGNLADEFQYWLGKTRFESGQFDAAAGAFAALLKSYTNSPLRLEASFGEAEARFKLRQFPQVEQLLNEPSGVFRTVARTRPPTDTLVVRGELLLAESLMEQRKTAQAGQLLTRVPDAGLPPRLRWLRQYLLCRAQFLAQQIAPALAGATNLIAIAATTADASLRATAIALQGELLEALHQPDAAIAAYEANLAPTAPAERRREAMLKSVELSLDQDRVNDAIAKLERFLKEQPSEGGSDVALLTLGELRLKQRQLSTNAAAPPPAISAGGTNLLDLALGDLNRLVRDFPNSPFVPKAQLSRGWVLLAQGRAADSLGAFQAAAERLPLSEGQAVARFKLADLQFMAGDFTNAIVNYRHVATGYRGLPRVQAELVGRALYQMVQAGIAAHDLGAAEEAVEKVLATATPGTFAERSLLLFGEALGDPKHSRKVFAEFAELFPNSRLLPEVKLAVARSYEQESNWTAAIAEYERWTTQFPTNDNLPRAEFFLGLACDQAGRETNTLSLFTNLVQRFPTHPLAARAQNWIGDYYFTLGKLNNSEANFPAAESNFREAEKNYQLLLSTNWPVTALTFEARLKAGRAAFHRLSWDNAISYFTNLIKDPGCPGPIAVEAVFAYGDTFIQRPSTNAVEKYGTALTIFGLVPRGWAQDANVPRAWGRMGDCQFQLGSLGVAADSYEKAYEFYRNVTNAANADITARSQAEVGMGNVRRAQAGAVHNQSEATARLAASARLDEALGHYLNVFYATNLRANETAPDPMWVKIAALEAANVAELQKKWSTAVKVYFRLVQMLPAIRPSLEKRLNFAREQEALQKP